MKKLTAKRPILYGGRMYQEGETLPAYDGKMVNAWLKAGTAAYTGQEEQEKPGKGTEGTATFEGVKVVEGRLDPKQLKRMKTEELESLAEKLGVDLSAAGNNTERADLIAAVTVMAPEPGGAGNDGGGAQ